MGRWVTSVFDSVSFLRSQGHKDPAEYPLWWLYEESDAARIRVNRVMHSELLGAQLANGANKNKKMFPVFKKFLERLLR